MIDLVGWLSSLVLLVTIIWQIRRQWAAGSSKGVSIWMFIGQLIASSGFTLYSFLIRDWVFVSTNVLMAISAMVGFSVVLYHRRSEQKTGVGKAKVGL